MSDFLCVGSSLTEPSDAWAQPLNAAVRETNPSLPAPAMHERIYISHESKRRSLIATDIRANTWPVQVAVSSKWLMDAPHTRPIIKIARQFRKECLCTATSKERQYLYADRKEMVSILMNFKYMTHGFYIQCETRHTGCIRARESASYQSSRIPA